MMTILILMGFVHTSWAIRDAPVTSVISRNACPGGQVVIPITVAGFTNIKAVNLRLEYDNSVMTFYSGVGNSNLPLVTFNASPVAGSGTLYKIQLAVYKSTAVTLNPTDTLVWLTFNYISGTTSLTFNNISNGGQDCEYGDENAFAMNDLPTTTFYHDGSVGSKGPGPAGPISGPTSVTRGQTGVAYSIVPVSNATGYSWTLPQGASIGSGLNTNSILVDFSGSAQSGIMTVAGTNICGAGTPAENLNITVGSIVPSFLQVSNIYIGNGQSVCFEASQTINVAGDGTPVVILNGGTATFVSAGNIRFLPGFACNAGGIVHGNITTNGVYCQSATNAPGSLIYGGPDHENQKEVRAIPRFVVYPNPTAGDIMVEPREKGLSFTGKVTIYGVMGNEVYSKHVFSSSAERIALSNFPKGLYLIKLEMQGAIDFVKILKQ